MRCVRCGAPLARDPDHQASQERCPRCGALAAAVASAPPLLPGAYGIPVQRFHPTVAGPPVAPEPYARGERLSDRLSDRLGERRIPAIPAARLRIVIPPLAPHRRSGIYAGLTALLALIVLAGIAAGLVVRAAGGNLQLGPIVIGGPRATLAPPTATPAAECRTPAIGPSAAATLAHVQMTTGLRDPAARDFRPVDDVTAFRVGQRAYITFQIATTQAGTVDATFCTAAGIVPGTLAIPPKSSGLYGQFSIALTSQSVGPGQATLRWDGQPAASVAFSVSPYNPLARFPTRGEG
jgi:hypothetical protein